MPLTNLTKWDIALSQLNQAINFYLEDRDLVSATTLAGAAEEILGQLCEGRGVGPRIMTVCIFHAISRR